MMVGIMSCPIKFSPTDNLNISLVYASFCFNILDQYAGYKNEARKLYINRKSFSFESVRQYQSVHVLCQVEILPQNRDIYFDYKALLSGIKIDSCHDSATPCDFKPCAVER